MVRFGIIGAGTMGKAHAQSISHIPSVQLTAVADTNPSKAQELANTHQAKPIANITELIQSSDVDAVIIASPTPFHFAQAKEAIEAGKHVYIEIPMVRHQQEADELVNLAEQNKVIVTVGHSQRYHLEIEAIKQQYESGAVGKPAMIRFGRRTPHPRSWYSNFESSGGVIFDAMIHELDLLNWIFGPSTRVYCNSLYKRVSTEQLDYALAMLRLENGAIAHVESSWCHYGQFIIDAEIAGEKGLIHFDNQESIPLKVSLVNYESSARQYFNESPVNTPAVYQLLREFVKAINGKADNPVPANQGREAVKLALAALESAQSKRPVTL